MKKILPSMREKVRYIGFEIIGENTAKSDFTEEFFKSAKEFIGQLGLSKAKPYIVILEKNKGIIKCERNFVPEIKICLSLVRKIKNSEVIVFSKIVSGTIKNTKGSVF